MTKTLREQLAEIERMGLTIVDISHGKHAKIRILLPDGGTLLVVVPHTPSD